MMAMSSSDNGLSVACFVTLFTVFCQLSHEAQIIFREVPKDVLVADGDQIQFNCSANSANPFKEPTYFWKFNGNYVADKNDLGFILGRKNLLIENVNSTVHEGIYQCVAFMEEYGAIISQPAKLQTIYLSISSVYTKTYTLRNGEYLFIKAPTISGKPAPTFNWKYEDKITGTYIAVDMNDAYLTKYGDLLFPSIRKTYSTIFRLYAVHPAISETTVLAEITVGVAGPNVACPNSTVVFPLREDNKVVNEGQSVLLECAGVAMKCRDKREVNWVFHGIEYGDRFVMRNIRKSNEGVYSCYVKIGSRERVGYNITLTVIEKPRLFVPIPQDITINTQYNLVPGFVNGATKVEWYTNGEKITSATNLFRVNSQNRLRFLQPSKSQSGVYQVIQSNAAGSVIQNINIFVETGYGHKVSGNYGNVSFVPPVSSPSGAQYASWQIQVPAIRTIYLTLTDPPKCSLDGTTQLHVYQGPTSNGALISRICKDSTYRPVMRQMKGPFITLVLVTRNLGNSGFIVHFNINRVVTTLRPTTLSSTTLESTTKEMSSSTLLSSTTETDRGMTSTITESTTSVTTQSVSGGAKRKDGESGTPIGAIVGGIIGVILLIAVLLGVFLYRRRLQEQKMKGQTAGFDIDKPHIPPRNTYLMRRPGADPNVPCFTVQPSGRPMPDVIPSYDSVGDTFEMGYLGQCQEDGGNQTYETVEEVLAKRGYDGHNIGNLAYQPGKAPKKVIGRRIPSGPGSKHDSNIIRPDASPRPLDHSIAQQEHHPIEEETYDSVGDRSDYLTPVDNRPRAPSMEGRPLPSPTEPVASSPVYHTLEVDEPATENQTYESPDDVIEEFKKLDVLERGPSERSENRYAALDENNFPAKENGYYEPLTLDRNAKPPAGVDDIDGGSDAGNQDDTIEADEDYSDPYEPTVQKEPDTSVDVKPAKNDGEYQALRDNNNHMNLEQRPSVAYESLQETGDGIGNYQSLTLQRRAAADDGFYDAI